MACWARLAEPDKAIENFNYCIHNYTLPNLFSICSRALQVDGTFGVTAAIAEMLIQSHEDAISFFPALPKAWAEGEGEAKGLCARGGFEVSLSWANREYHDFRQADILSKKGKTCRIRTDLQSVLQTAGKLPKNVYPKNGIIEFETKPGQIYTLLLGVGVEILTQPGR
jgi:alpha-L-fucosidase 2